MTLGCNKITKKNHWYVYRSNLSLFVLKDAKHSIILLPVFLLVKNSGKCAFTERQKAMNKPEQIFPISSTLEIVIDKDNLTEV